MEKVKQIGPSMEEKVPLGTPTTVTHQIRWEIRQDNQEKDSLKHSKKKKEKGKRKERKTQLLSVRNCMIPLMMPLHDTFWFTSLTTPPQVVSTSNKKLNHPFHIIL